MTSPDRSALHQDDPSAGGDLALQGRVGVAALKQSARLAGLCGGVLLLLTGLLVWIGAPATRLEAYWLVWAALPALAAAFGAPLISRFTGPPPLTPWLLALVLLMLLNSSAWVFASAAAVAREPAAVGLLVIAFLALSVALIPSLTWLPGLLLHLFLQLLLMLAFGPTHSEGLSNNLLPLGLWMSLSVLAVAAGLFARRAQRSRGDVHYLRYENAELQKQWTIEHGKLGQAAASRQRLEAELAEILNLAEDASRAKTEFLATMSHEIRTPLNGIVPILEMLQESRLDREQQRLVRTAQSSSRHLLRIINDILDFAKVESGKLQLEAIEIDVRELVGSVGELMRGSARNHNLKLSIRVADNVPDVVRGDPIRLRQVLINLVSNAIKFTEEGGIRIEVSRGQTSQKEVELLFAIADTGIGMSQETTDRLFQLFTQADASTTRKHGGTGLGLVICKRLVELMGGKIGVRSTPGQGSTFWFLVPLRRSVIEVPSARRDLKGVRVLTLIDDEHTAERITESLLGWGVSEETTSDPQEALAVLRARLDLGESWGFQLALIDGNGLESRLPQLLGEIRSIESLRKLHIIVAVRSDTLAQKIKRDYQVLVLSDELRPEPLRRLMHRLFDVESRRYGNQSLRPEEIYDDLNLPPVEILPLTNESHPVHDDHAPRVLLVEDNPVNQGVVSKGLSLLGVQCQNAENGKVAIERCRREPFDLVFMDCQMPVMDGYEATAEIRRAEKADGRSPTPIVAMTANAMAGDREKCLAAGMDDYLAKPVGIDQLRRCLSNWLPSGVRRRSSEAAEESGSTEAMIPPEQKSVLDANVLKELSDIMEDDYIGLLETYLHNGPDLIAELRSALDRGDLQAAVIPAHSLKSSSANVGALGVSTLARDIEQYARAGDLDAARHAFSKTETGFDLAIQALREHTRNHQLAHSTHSASEA